eukprot:TRINITY_DN13_c0_g1_i6.p2 TRINITY_DN13_c0_g1~~TRINITY_DN13_c0_g1_i6.p2  ORF type:complete len:305 (-),score=-47.89 TRINITY_DN13_c0_g1_i6:4733-5647(-)
MIDKIKEFPIESYYFLESEDFLVHRAKFYFKKDKRIKLNSYWIGLSKLRVNNDKMLYLFNGLRGYYEVRSRYFKDPKIMKKRVPLSKLTFINDYLVKKYKFSDLFIYSLKNFNRPTIRLAKEGNAVYYSFPYKLINYLNRRAEVKIARENNKKFSLDVRSLKNIGLRFYVNPRRRMKGFRKAQALPGISLGFGEIFLLQHIKFLKYFYKFKQKINSRIFDQRARYKRKRIKKFDLFYKASNVLRFLVKNKKRKFRIIRFLNKLNKKRKEKIKKIRNSNMSKLTRAKKRKKFRINPKFFAFLCSS